jgi:hypothetical protein
MSFYSTQKSIEIWEKYLGTSEKYDFFGENMVFSREKLGHLAQLLY